MPSSSPLPLFSPAHFSDFRSLRLPPSHYVAPRSPTVEAQISIGSKQGETKKMHWRCFRGLMSLLSFRYLSEAWS